MGGFGSLSDSATLCRLCVRLALLLFRLGLLMVTKLGAADSVDEDDRNSFDLILDSVVDDCYLHKMSKTTSFLGCY